MFKTIKTTGYTLKDCIKAKKEYGYHEKKFSGRRNNLTRRMK